MYQKLIKDYFNFISKNKDIIKNIDNLDNVNPDNIILEIDKQIEFENEQEETVQDILVFDEEVFNNNLKLLKNYIENIKNKKNKIKYLNLIENENIIKLIKILSRNIVNDNVYFKRLLKEFSLILDFRFEEVFYQVFQILELTKEYPHIIRGSAGSCLLCFLMGITNIDPIKENIELSRFMHKSRKSIPDIDIDFPALDRDKIYKKIFTNWKDKVARISNHIKFKEKSAIRQAIRDYGYRKFVSKDKTLYDVFKDEKNVKEIVKKIEKNAREKIGNFRCYSLHCGGIVIFKNNVPANLILKDFNITDNFTGKQIWMDKDQVEDADMIKIDILSNRGLSQLWNISRKPIIDYPYSDEETYKLLSSGLNIGITHAESRGMMKIFKTMKPKSLKEIAIALALIRPAAAKNQQKIYFLQDYTPYKYDNDNELFIIFDDDATMFIKKILNCNTSRADNYRRAFSKGKQEQIKSFISIFKKIWEDIDKNDKDYENNENNETNKFLKELKKKKTFDDILERLYQLEYYSFCKSHAYSYAQLVFALSYQKIHNPLLFWTSTLNVCNTSYRKWVHFREAKNAGLELTLAKKPYILLGNKLVSKKDISKEEKETYDTPIKQLFKYGYWISNEFLPGMYYEEYWINFTKRYRNLNNLILKEETINGKQVKKIKYAKFKGIIATHRSCKKETKKGYITFVTISTDNNHYIDIVIHGYHKVGKMMCLSGYGKLKEDSDCKWIDVIKWKNEYLN
jgi:DNA polymerase-3 subunit alpha